MARRWPLPPYRDMGSNQHTPHRDLGRHRAPQWHMGTHWEPHGAVGTLPGCGPLLLGRGHPWGTSRPRKPVPSCLRSHAAWTAALPCTAAFRVANLPGHALAGVARGAREGPPLLTFFSCCLRGVLGPAPFQAEAVDVPQAPGQQGGVGLQPAEQFVLAEAALSPAVCPHGR